MIFTAIFPVTPTAPTIQFMGVAGPIGDPISAGITIHGTTAFSPDIPRPAGALTINWTDPTSDLVLTEDALAAEAAWKLNVGAPDQAIEALPADPGSSTLCRVYGYLKGPGGQVASNADVVFQLRPNDEPLYSGGKLVYDRIVQCKTNNIGLLDIRLERTDQLETVDTETEITWLISCNKLGLKEVPFLLTAGLFDISTLGQAP